MAQIRAKDSSGTLRTIARIRGRDEDNILRTFKRVRMRDEANVLQTVYDLTAASGSADVEVSDYEVYASKEDEDKSNLDVISETITSTINYGTGPYTYAWEYVSGSTSITAVTPTSSSTQFRCLNFSGVKQTVFHLKVTDSLSSVKTSANITVELEAITH